MGDVAKLCHFHVELPKLRHCKFTKQNDLFLNLHLIHRYCISIEITDSPNCCKNRHSASQVLILVPFTPKKNPSSRGHYLSGPPSDFAQDLCSILLTFNKGTKEKNNLFKIAHVEDGQISRLVGH